MLLSIAWPLAFIGDGNAQMRSAPYALRSSSYAKRRRTISIEITRLQTVERLRAEALGTPPGYTRERLILLAREAETETIVSAPGEYGHGMAAPMLSDFGSKPRTGRVCRCRYQLDR